MDEAYLQGVDLMKLSFKVEGMDKLKKDLEKLGKVPQKHVTSSAKKGMNIVLRESKASAPYDTGQLKQGIVFDHKMNEVFQKKNKEGKITGYYPVSQEYGFFAKNGRYVPGYRFIHDSLTENTIKISRVMIDTMKTKIDAEIRKAGLK